MADTPTTNGNGKGWVKHIPLGLAFIAAVAAGATTARVGFIADDMAVLKSQAGYQALDARTRANTEAIGALTGEVRALAAEVRAWITGHDAEKNARVVDFDRRVTALERRLK